MYVDCPACQTRLQVRAEQLRMGRGEVSCSICRHCFDALARLQDDEEAESGRDTLPRVDSLSGPGGDKLPLKFGMADRGISELDVPAIVAIAPAPMAQDDDSNEVQEKSRSAAGWWLALGGIAGMLLGVQVLMVFGPRWLADPAWRPLLEWSCARLQSMGAGCSLPPLVDLRLLALEEHRFTTHPQRERGLLFDAELVNRASFAQAYPRLRLSVEDPWGGSMAIGTFGPEHYLHEGFDRTAFLPPDARVAIHLELLDPGSRAAGYRFDLLPPE